MGTAELKHLVVLTLVMLVVIVGSNYYTYNSLDKKYSNQLNSLNEEVSTLDTKIDTKTNEITGFVTSEIDKTSKEIDNTKKEINKVESTINEETSKLKTDILQVQENTQTSLEEFSGQVDTLSQRSSELENQLADIEINSADFSAIVEDVVKAVVSIRSNKGQGSGVIYDSRGYVLTNAHVVQGASSIELVDYNSQTYSVSSVAIANGVDLAVLKINSNNNFRSLEFASNSDIKVGERVIAVGNPLGLSFSVTEGIISAKDRNIDSTGIGYVQIDVPINPGNSGGPLVNNQKKIIGINTFKIVNTEGIGFAIPSTVAKSVADAGIQ